MRISIIGPAYPLRGGIAHHVYSLHQQLTSRNHNVQVVSFRKLYPRLFFPGETERDRSGLKLDARATPILAPLNPATWWTAFKLVRSFSPDVIVFEWWQPFFAPLVGTLARCFRRAGLRCIIECHNVFPHERTPLDRPLIKFALRAADHLITHSNSDRNEVSALFPAKPVSVSPLPTLDDFIGGSPRVPDGRTLLFFGKVRKYKGLKILLQAMPDVLKRIDCQLLVVGEFYDSIEEYERLIRELGIGDSVRIDNRYVSNEEVPALFNLADVLVLPYLSATQSAVARLALSNGLPIIASRTGGLAESVSEGVSGLLFPPGDYSALADAIVDYFTTNRGPVFSQNILAASKETRCTIVETIEEFARAKC
jgi:glycosyltransferase involved in cell wall biosynthesis